MADALTRIQSSTSRVTGASPSQKGKGSSQAGTMPPSKKGSAVKHADSTTDITDGVHNVDAVAYTDARCYIYLEFTLAQPLIPKRQPEELAQLVSEYIPPRPLITVPLGGAEKAVDDYHNQLSAVASMVLDEFQSMFGDDLINGGLDNSAMSQMKRKKELLYQLNSSGKYFAFKEQLKHSIVKIVREKYLHTSVFKSSELLQKFLSELFVFLIDEMHISLGKMLNTSSQANDAPEPKIDICQLKKFAQEAEVNGDFDLALKYYKDCIAKEGKNPDHWFDYGTFCMLQEDYAKAKECFKESVALRQTYREGLLLYGIMCAMDSNFLEAEAIFERATTLTDSGDSLPPSLPWTIMALFYEIQGNEILSEHAFSEANKLNSIIAAGDLIDNAQELPEDEETAEDMEHGGSPQKTESGVTVVSKAEDSRPKSGATMSLASHSVLDHHETQAEHKGDGIADTSMPISLANVMFQTIFLQAANWLLDRKALKFAEIALSRELLAPQGGPSAEYYIALGRLHMVRKNFDEAKENLSKAVAMDIEHAEAWALLGHVHYLCGEVDDAQDCYERTISFVTNASEMHTVYLRLASIYLEKGKFSEAKRTYLLACKYSPTCNSWLGVGMACYRLDEISEAENALAEANILNNMNADVWAYLSLVCLKTERKIEAEQSYKYAIKLDLQDEHLLGEIKGLQKTIGFGDPSF